MITVESRILKNYLVLDIDGKVHIVKPAGYDEPGLSAALKRFFTLKYYVLDDTGIPIYAVRYNDIKDSFIIQRGEFKLETTGHMFKPHEFIYNGKKYLIHEKMTGGIFITCGKKVVARGKCGLKKVTFSDYAPELKEILPAIAVGYCIKMLAWHMYF